jgi:hypothetical protein
MESNEEPELVPESPSQKVAELETEKETESEIEKGAEREEDIEKEKEIEKEEKETENEPETETKEEIIELESLPLKQDDNPETSSSNIDPEILNSNSDHNNNKNNNNNNNPSSNLSNDPNQSSHRYDNHICDISILSLSLTLISNPCH